MTRISLTEAYDDRSVISKLEKMSDQVDANTETCDSAVKEAKASAESSEASRQASETAKAGALDAQTKANEASAKAVQASAQVTDKVAKTGTSAPQIITGTGGLQIQGNLSVGGDLTVSESGSVHFGGSNMEVGGMVIEKSSTATVLSNEIGGIRFKGSVTVPTTATGVKTQDAVNGQRLQSDLDAYEPMVRTTGNQTITGNKRFKQLIYSDSFIINEYNDTFIPHENKVFQIEVDSSDGYTQYIAFNNSADGGKSINIVIKTSETGDVAYFNLTHTAEGTNKIFTNFEKPEGW